MPTRLLSALMVVAGCAGAPVEEPVRPDRPDDPVDTDPVPDPGQVERHADALADVAELSSANTALAADLRAEPHSDHPLMILAHADCQPECSVSVRLVAPDGRERLLAPRSSEPSHRRLVAGLRANTTYTVEITAFGPSGESTAREHLITTGRPEFWIPRATVTLPGDPGGLVLSAARLDHSGERYAVYFALDAEGHVVWYYRQPMVVGAPPTIRARGDGTFFIREDHSVSIIDVEGNELWRTDAVSSDGRWHHDAIELPGGGLLVLTEEEVDLGEHGESVPALADMVLELDSHGRRIGTWRAFETLDRERFPGPLSRKPVDRVDWTHGNAVSMLPDERGYMVSLRHQSWIVAVDRETQDVDWILGEDGDFELLSGTWFNAQHDPSFVSATDVLVYDNGTERHDAGLELGSRVVKYKLDFAKMQAREIFSWELPVYTPFMGGVRAGDDGNVLVTAGGRLDGKSSFYLVDDGGEPVWAADFAAWTFRGEIFDGFD